MNRLLRLRQQCPAWARTGTFREDFHRRVDSTLHESAIVRDLVAAFATMALLEGCCGCCLGRLRAHAADLRFEGLVLPLQILVLSLECYANRR